MEKSEKFEGLIGRTHTESTPWWPPLKRLEAGGPNMVIILLDDTGFAHLGCYGSTIETPIMERRRKKLVPGRDVQAVIRK